MLSQRPEDQFIQHILLQRAPRQIQQQTLNPLVQVIQRWAGQYLLEIKNGILYCYILHIQTSNRALMPKPKGGTAATKGGAAETKLERFERIAERRVNAAVRVIRLIGNLADRHNYDYSDAHVQQILSAIEQEVRVLKSRFRSDVEGHSKQFKFREGG